MALNVLACSSMAMLTLVGVPRAGNVGLMSRSVTRRSPIECPSRATDEPRGQALNAGPAGTPASPT